MILEEAFFYSTSFYVLVCCSCRIS